PRPDNRLPFAPRSSRRLLKAASPPAAPRPRDHMPDFEFQGTLYPNARQMHDAMAEQWLGAQGANSEEDIRSMFLQPAGKLAEEAAEAFGLYENPAFSLEALCNAFNRLRDEFHERFQDGNP